MAWAPDYVTDEELRVYLRVDDLEDDVQAALAITAASRAVDVRANRQFGKVTAAAQRVYTAWPYHGRGRWAVTIDDVMTATGMTVEVDGTVVTSAGYRLEPVNAPGEGRPWTRLVFLDAAEATPTYDPHEVAVTALWGWTAVPTAVKQATLLQASRFLKRRDAPFGVAGSPDTGSELRLLAKVDPDVAVALAGYSRARAFG